MDRQSLTALFTLHLIFLGFIAVLPLLLLIHGETEGGRWVGLALTSLVLGTLTPWLFAFHQTRKAGKVVLVLVTLLIMGGFSKAFLLAPEHPDESGQFTEYYLDQTHYRRASLARLVPEIDQLKLGGYLFGVIDPFMDFKQAKQVRDVVNEVYHEMRQDEDFRNSSSALGMAYQDMFLANREPLHFYQYQPKRSGNDILLFLHGSLGNFKGYLWSLKETADATGMTIVAPTFGMGNWHLDKDCSRVAKMIDYCKQESSLANKRIFLAGISNGGRGCMRAIRTHGHTFAGLILISPVIEDYLISPQSLQSLTPQLPILILHGTEDRRIPFQAIQHSTSLLKAAGASVDLRRWEGEDHFLMFRQRQVLSQEISSWIQDQESVGQPGKKP